MQLCDQFRALVDKSIEQAPAPDSAAIEARYAKEFQGVQPVKRYEPLYKLICEDVRFPGQSGISLQQFRELKKALKFQSIVGLAPDPYWQIAHRIHDACHPEYFRPLSEEQEWLSAIHAARSCDVLSGALAGVDLRTNTVIQAAKRMINYGYPVRSRTIV